MKATHATLVIALAGSMFLSGCGGGGGSSNDPPPQSSQPPPPTPQPPAPSPPTPSPPTPSPPAAQVPTAPTGLTATSGDKQILLTWSTAAGATSYKVYRGGTVVASPTAGSYTDSGLTNGVTYTYEVSAANADGESARSAATSATPQAPQSTCAFPTLPANDCNPWLPLAASGKSWQLSFSEEFNGTDYDRAKFTPCFDWNYGGCSASFNQGREHYAASQVQVGGGIAKLVARPNSPPIASGGCQGGQCTYLSGLLSTARPRADNGSDYLFKFTYGYVEAKLKLIGTQGFFTAFWMLPADPDYDYATEIDILEHLGHDPATMFMTYHYNDRSQSHAVNTGVGNNGACAAVDYTADFHRFGLDWQPSYVAWYIDGVKCGQFNGNTSTVEDGPMQIILNVMVDVAWQRDWNKGLLDPTLSRSLEVDYVRVFQQR